MKENNNQNTFVSVVMPVYNGSAFLKEAIASILEQTYTNYEFIIINDGSTDLSENIILSYSDSRIRYVKHEKNIHLVGTLNEGITLAKGKYIIRMDQDDISLPQRIEKQVLFMEQNSEIGICGSWFKTIGAVEKYIEYPVEHDEICVSFLFFNPFCHPSTIWRKSFILKNNIKFNSNYNYAEDYKFFWDCSLHMKCANISEVLLFYRIHNSQMFHLSPSTYYETVYKVKNDIINSVNTIITKKEIEQWINQKNTILISFISKLILGNKKSLIFNQSILERKFATIWKNCFLEAKHISISDYWLFITQSISKKANFTVKQKLAVLRKLFQ